MCVCLHHLHPAAWCINLSFLHHSESSWESISSSTEISGLQGEEQAAVEVSRHCTEYYVILYCVIPLQEVQLIYCFLVSFQTHQRGSLNL